MKIYIFLLMILLVPSILALDCPRAIVNDPYPGVCGLYEDSNNDGLCDYSQTIETSEQANINPVLISNQNSKTYYFLQISLITVLIYLISFILAKLGKISQVFHKRFWNFLLLVSFLGVGISGILLVLRVEFGINFSSPFNMLFWHVETGIVMTIISIFHILWHIAYFRSYIRK